MVNIEIGNNWLSLNAHVGRRIKVGLLDILQMFYKCLLRCATCAGMLFDRSCIHHDGKCKSRVGFSLFHDLESSEITGGSVPVPVNDDAINAAADHVLNLPCDLLGTGGVITYIHVAGSAEPAHQVRINLGMVPGIK